MDDLIKLPEWKCHKVVRADVIVRIMPFDDNSASILRLACGLPVMVDAAWCARHKAVEGGYFVVYEDGYQSFSPAAAFESGYTRIPAPAPEGALFHHPV